LPGLEDIPFILEKRKEKRKQNSVKIVATTIDHEPINNENMTPNYSTKSPVESDSFVEAACFFLGSPVGVTQLRSPVNPSQDVFNAIMLEDDGTGLMPFTLYF
jgi:hypothetical protein